ncbi:MAG: oxidoreductase, partial [Proteobacteria bacterium]|nr:oxidoreductase [Pseudomonadota bacterium]
ELGDFTATIKAVEPGEVVYLDAPYGVFSIDRHPAPGYGFVVGGIGITPVMSMLRSMSARGDRRPLWLFYGSASEDEIVYREEIDAMRERLALTVVHILEKPSDAWSGETGFVTREILARHLPGNRAALRYFLCGPTPMIAAAERALRELGVPADHMQSELFELV